MKRIFKYRLPRDGETVTIEANVVKWLEVKSQDGWPHIWAIVDEEGYPQQYEIVAWGTGWEYPEELNHCQYMGTAIDFAGYVWHYFMQQVAFATATTTYDYYPEVSVNKLSTTAGAPYADPYSVTICCDSDKLTYTNSATSAVRTPFLDDASVAYVESLIRGLEGARATTACSAHA